MTNELLDAFELDFPLFLAGMGGVAGPELVAAVANAGCAGVLGLYKTPSQHIGAVIRRTEELTARGYGVNFVPEVVNEDALLDRIDAVVAATTRKPFVSFFGVASPAVNARVRAHGLKLVVQVGGLDEALQAADADALIVQGTEAGGHLLGDETTATLLHKIGERLPAMPLIAAGGVSSGAALARLMLAGARGGCCGTLFLASSESRAHPIFKREVINAAASDTVITSVFEIGWPRRRHRVIRTPFVTGVERGVKAPALFIASTTVYQSKVPIPRYSSTVPTIETSGRVEEMALYCGTSCTAVRAERPAAAIVAELRAEYKAARCERSA
jgi:nitronate monooxygenase